MISPAPPPLFGSYVAVNFLYSLTTDPLCSRSLKPFDVPQIIAHPVPVMNNELPLIEF